MSKIISQNHDINGGISIDTFTLSAKQAKFFTHARHMAEMSDFHRAPVGCVAVIGNKVVATGFSQQRTHPLQMRFNRYRDFNCQTNIEAKMHAEISMLASYQHMGIDWSKVDVYIYRLCRSRPHGLSCPCESCMAALTEAGVHRIFFSTDTGFDFIKVA